MAKVGLEAALAALADAGIELDEEQTALLGQFKTVKMRESASEVIGRKLTENNKKNRDEWVKRSFDFAESMAENFTANKVGRGRGEVMERVFRIDTPHGTFKVSLSESPEEDTEE